MDTVRLMRLRYALVLVLLVPAGFFTKLYVGPAESWVRAHGGGIVYVLFWCLFAQTLWPRVSPWRIATVILLVTCTLEFLQLWHPPFLAPLRANFLGHALIGSKFSWWDFPYYVFGALLAVGVARLVSSAGRDDRKRAA